MSRSNQPYKGGKGPAGPTLYAMLKGAGKFTANPMDARRKAIKQLHKRKRRRKRLYRGGV